MQAVTVTIENLEEHKDGILSAVSVQFSVIQDGNRIIQDSLSGKCTGPYERNYTVSVTDSPLHVEHDRPDLTWLKISAKVTD